MIIFLQINNDIELHIPKSHWHCSHWQFVIILRFNECNPLYIMTSQMKMLWIIDILIRNILRDNSCHLKCLCVQEANIIQNILHLSKGFRIFFQFLILIMRDSIALKPKSISGNHATSTLMLWYYDILSMLSPCAQLLLLVTIFYDDLQQSNVAHLQGDTVSRHYQLWPKLLTWRLNLLS